MPARSRSSASSRRRQGSTVAELGGVGSADALGVSAGLVETLAASLGVVFSPAPGAGPPAQAPASIAATAIVRTYNGMRRRARCSGISIAPTPQVPLMKPLGCEPNRARGADMRWFNGGGDIQQSVRASGMVTPLDARGGQATAYRVSSDGI